MAQKNPNIIDLYQAFFESSEIAAVIARTNGTILHANRQFIKLSGYKKTEITKKKWSELIINGDLTKIKQHQEFVDYNIPDAAQTTDFKLATKDGSLKSRALENYKKAGYNVDTLTK